MRIKISGSYYWSADKNIWKPLMKCRYKYSEANNDLRIKLSGSHYSTVDKKLRWRRIPWLLRQWFPLPAMMKVTHGEANKQSEGGWRCLTVPHSSCGYCFTHKGRRRTIGLRAWHWVHITFYVFLNSLRVIWSFRTCDWVPVKNHRVQGESTYEENVICAPKISLRT